LQRRSKFTVRGVTVGNEGAVFHEVKSSASPNHQGEETHSKPADHQERNPLSGRQGGPVDWKLIAVIGQYEHPQARVKHEEERRKGEPQ